MQCIVYDEISAELVLAKDFLNLKEQCDLLCKIRNDLQKGLQKQAHEKCSLIFYKRTTFWSFSAASMCWNSTTGAASLKYQVENINNDVVLIWLKYC